MRIEGNLRKMIMSRRLVQVQDEEKEQDEDEERHLLRGWKRFLADS